MLYYLYIIYNIILYTYKTCIRDPYSASVSGVSQVHRRMDFGFPRVKYPGVGTA